MVQLIIHKSANKAIKNKLVRQAEHEKISQYHETIEDLRNFLQENYFYLPDKYTPRSIIESSYNNYRTQGNIALDRTLSSSYIGRCMGVIAKEQNLQYKRMNFGQAYVGISSKLAKPELSNEEKRDICNARQRDNYAKIPERHPLGVKVNRYKRSLLVGDDAPFTEEQYKIILNNKLSVWCYKLRKADLPWRSGKLLDEDIDTTIERCIDVDSSIQRTIECYQNWIENNRDVNTIMFSHNQQYIYILHDKCTSAKDRYKLGYHTGTKKQLMWRYITAIPHVEVLFFEPYDNAIQIEAMMKERYRDIREVNTNGNLSEWYNNTYEDLAEKLKDTANSVE